ncbi:2-oxoglutarate dehydrogenase complex dihydrolipoyllysine-residue succinyltransferase [Marinospirillum sp.]|uniref:2-oxoglutarate dehydrogenase complex dihydrolipoyllysine-residue succinyltransferase n=1 Tax=Marinospirillum sp. TaxID=2183934 RepID=UPI00286FDDD9|nr:2-oxoglutarate dehydrogenase complex dihydrolipoyllysine-residue succinyltransferase [Marinospirillum sp.]MDR9467173.1 2-oxoglutarate dehydrogenase complex dihydrolipoyllysine-residue succinyltransferase [Marinospirillum sp.]
MAIEIKAPTFPESVAEGTVATWHKQPGEAVERDEILVDIETDKVVLEVPASADGVLEEILANEGDTVESDQLLGKIKEGAAPAAKPAAEEKPAAAESKETSAAQTSGDEKVAPAARKLANEKDVDLSQVQGSGKGGLITKEDVQKAISGAGSKPAPAPAAPQVQVAAGEKVEKRVPMSRMRQTIAKRLVQAQQTAAMLTTYNEVDMKPVMELRKRYKEQFEKRHDGTRLGFMSFFVKAATEALKRFPDVNASIDGTDIVYHAYQDIGVAVSTSRGLMVPVLRDCDSMNLADIESTIADFGKRGREGKIGIDDLQGGTFTITNGGIFGSLMSTPILNPPQTAILGMHKIQERPMAVNGQVEIRPMMYLALSYDHRMIDGKDAVQFLVTIKELLEDPARILLDV